MIGVLSMVARGAAAFGSAVACAALVIVTLHIFADTIATKFFNAPFNATHTAVTRYYMVALVFLALANVELRDGHLSADLFYSLLPKHLKRWARALNLALLSGFTALLTWQVLLKAIAQTSRGEKRIVAGIEYLYWPSRWIAVVGMFAFTLVAVMKLIQFLSEKEDADGTTSPEGDR